MQTIVVVNEPCVSDLRQSRALARSTHIDGWQLVSPTLLFCHPPPVENYLLQSAYNQLVLFLPLRLVHIVPVIRTPI